MEPAHWILMIAGAYVGFSYLLAPLILGTTLRLKAFPSYEAISPDGLSVLSATTREFFGQSSDALTALGFRLIACGRQMKQMTNVSVYVMRFRNAEQDWATVSYMLLESKDAKQELSYVELSTTYVDETMVATCNLDQLPLWKTGPRRRQFWLPNVQDIARLYQIHRELVRRHRTDSSPREVRDTHALTFLAETIQRELRDQEAKGWFYLDPAAIEYRPTMKGAYLMTWRRLWPLSAIRKLQRNLEARELESSIDHPSSIR